jgi:hypothetical protein
MTKKVLSVIAFLTLSAAAANAEIKHLELSIFGMD